MTDRNAAPPDDLGPIEIDVEIVGEFIVESAEQLSACDDHLLTLDATPDDAEAVHAVFRSFHTLKGLAGFLGFWPIERLAHAAEDLLDQADSIPLDEDAINAVFDAVDLLRSMSAEVEAAVAGGLWVPADAGAARALEHEIRRIHRRREEESQGVPAGAPDEAVPGLVTFDEPENEITDDTVPGLVVFDDPEPSEAPANPPGLIVFDEPDAVSAPVPPSTPTAPARQAEASATEGPGGDDAAPARVAREPVRVDADRLDRLVDLIGELVIAQSMVNGAARTLQVSEASRSEWEGHIGHLGKITREVQSIASSLRMVPVRPVFRRMARLARDVARKSGKRVDFRVSGEDTELDKSLVDRIGDPLVHLIRNAIDHGLEPDVDRRASLGKPAQGVVELTASHQAGSICISVSDDGRGLDKEAIVAKAIARGIVDETDHLSEADVYHLIFEPGFSTAEGVTEISGRGVGMDVVRRSAEDMGGRIEVTSAPGEGTTVSLILPLTMAVIDGLVVEAGGERYIVPTLDVVRVITPRDDEISTIVQRGEVVIVGDELVPLFRLSEILATGSDARGALALVAQSSGRRVALSIDEVLEQHQLVIKSLGTAAVDGVSGAAIMPDGRVGLVLDVAGLVRLAGRRQRRATPAAAAR